MSASIHYIKPKKPSVWWNTHTPMKIAAFDFDHTLVCQKSNKKFPTDADDWKPQFESDVIKKKLTSLHKDGYIIVIVTNQGGVEKKKVTVDAMEKRIKNFTTYIGENVPVYTFAAIKYDHCRKPCTGVWDYITSGKWREYDIDVKKSFYVGDAAGRIKGWDPANPTRKDFSCSDRKFANNASLRFMTPEQFFLESEPTDKWEWGGIDPKHVIETRSQLNNPELMEQIDPPEMVILVGCAASGKSNLCTFFPNYVRINMDSLKTKNKCIKTTKAAVTNGKSVIVDNTNPDPKTRKLYIDIAKQKGYQVRCINVKCPKPLALHLNQYRVQLTGGKRRAVPQIAYNIYFKRYIRPNITEEDIDKVIDYEWVPNFPDEKHEQLFMMKY